MLTESTKKLRDPLALALLAAAALYLITTFFLLFKDIGDFADRAAELQGAFTDPAWILVVLAAVALVAAFDQPTPLARTITMVALGLLGFMLLLGVITWLAAYGADRDFEFVGKAAGTFYALARLLLVAVAALVAYRLFTSMPAPVRQPTQQGQPWGQPGQQGPYGQAPYGRPGPYIQQGAYGPQGQWEAPAAGGGAAVGGAWGVQPANDPSAAGQPSSGYAAGGDQAPWGQHDPYAQPPSSGQSSAGYAAGGDPGPWDQQHGAYAAPASSGQSSAGYAAGGDQTQWEQPQPEQQAWGEPQPEQQAWGEPQPEEQAGSDPTQSWEQPPTELDPHATVMRDPGVAPDPGAPEQPGDDAEQQAREDDQRPGWWAPGS